MCHAMGLPNQMLPVICIARHSERFINRGFGNRTVTPDGIYKNIHLTVGQLCHNPVDFVESHRLVEFYTKPDIGTLTRREGIDAAIITAVMQEVLS